MSVERVLEIGKQWYKVYEVSNSDRKILEDLYFEYTKKRIGTCPVCYVTMYNFFKNKNHKQMKTESKNVSNFQLHDTKVLWNGGKHITNANITDKDAVGLLKKDPAAIAHFKSFPNDWRKMCGFKDVEVVEVKNNVVDQEKYKLLNGLSLVELQEKAANMELPIEEWTNLKSPALKAYIVKNTNS